MEIWSYGETRRMLFVKLCAFVAPWFNFDFQQETLPEVGSNEYQKKAL